MRAYMVDVCRFAGHTGLFMILQTHRELASDIQPDRTDRPADDCLLSV